MYALNVKNREGRRTRGGKVGKGFCFCLRVLAHGGVATWSLLNVMACVIGRSRQKNISHLYYFLGTQISRKSDG